MSFAEDKFLCDCCRVESVHHPWDSVVGSDSQTYDLVECESCGVVTVHPPPSAEHLTAFYTRDYDGKVKSGIVDSPDPRANQAAIEDAASRLDYVRKYAGTLGDRVLDVGCGHGFFLFAAQQRGLDATGVDIDEGAIAYGTDVLGVRIVHSETDNLEHLNQGEFDLVTFWQVLEHLPRAGTCLRSAGDVLVDGGVVAGSMPNIGGIGSRLRGRKWDLLVPPEHVTYFDERSCRIALAAAGFEPLFVGTIPVYAAPYFKLGLRTRVMRAADRARTEYSRAIIKAFHRALTLGKRYLVYAPLNFAVMVLGIPGNSLFFVARKK